MKIPQAMGDFLRKSANKKKEWAKRNLLEKTILISQVKERLKKCAEQMVKVSIHYKGAEGNPCVESEEWFAGPVVLMRYLSLLEKTLKSEFFQPLKTSKKNKRLECEVLPQNIWEKLVWLGMSAKVILQEGREDSRAARYHNGNLDGLCSLVLGAGNVASIAAADALHKLFVENSICIVKMNPVNQYLCDVFQEIFQPLIDEEFLLFVTGDAEIGEILCQHEAIDNIHITGSEATHSKIVQGSPDPKEITQPKINKPITSELGCVSPVAIFPGVWTDSEMDFVTNHILGGMTNNASFNCNAMKVIAINSEWAQKKIFVQNLKNKLFHFPSRNAYYPGAKERYEKVLEANKQYQISKSPCAHSHHLPWTIIEGIPYDHPNPFFEVECFCSVFAIVEVPGIDFSSYSENLLEFFSQKLYGNLSASVFIHPTTKKIHRAQWNHFLENLNYGSIAINCWAALSYGLGVTTWGAFPGNTLQNVSSGIGTVHNSFFFDHPEKSIVEAPFYSPLTPTWTPAHKNALATAKALFNFESTPSLKKLLKLFQEALRLKPVPKN